MYYFEGHGPVSYCVPDPKLKRGMRHAMFCVPHAPTMPTRFEFALPTGVFRHGLLNTLPRCGCPSGSSATASPGALSARCCPARLGADCCDCLREISLR